MTESNEKIIKHKSRLAHKAEELYWTTQVG